MMSLCRTFHTMLGLSDPDRCDRNISHRSRNIPPPENGGLRCVIEVPPPPPPQPKLDRGGDPGAWGLHEAAGGLGLCTESLGSESCDVAPAGDLEVAAARSPRKINRSRRLMEAERTAKKKFPPPLSWLSKSNGRRSCFMKGERRDGRFVLMEVSIERPEVLRASRQNGRLRLYLAEESDCCDEAKVEEEEEEEEVRVTEAEEAEEERVEVSSVPMLRCQEAVSGNGNMPMWWNHRFITTA